MPRYVKVYETLFDHELFGDRFSRRDAWLWLITKARWRDQPGGGLKRGQVLGARSFLAAEWGWGEQEVRTFLAQLTARGMIEINQQGSRRPAVITICNYEKFQGTDENDNRQDNQHLTSTQPAPNQHLTTLEEGKKDRRIEEEDIGVPPSVAPAGPTPTDALKAFELYNAVALECGLAQASRLTPSRQKSLIARLREHGIDGWQTALDRVRHSAFLTGRNDKGWRADFDFLLQAKSLAKVIDGAYGNGRHVPTATPSKPAPSKAQQEQAFDDYLMQLANSIGQGAPQ
jgi:hypothetical protein